MLSAGKSIPAKWFDVGYLQVICPLLAGGGFGKEGGDPGVMGGFPCVLRGGAQNLTLSTRCFSFKYYMLESDVETKERC